jgi:hypothetical protein
MINNLSLFLDNDDVQEILKELKWLQKIENIQNDVLHLIESYEKSIAKHCDDVFWVGKASSLSADERSFIRDAWEEFRRHALARCPKHFRAWPEDEGWNLICIDEKMSLVRIDYKTCMYKYVKIDQFRGAPCPLFHHEHNYIKYRDINDFLESDESLSLVNTLKPWNGKSVSDIFPIITQYNYLIHRYFDVKKIDKRTEKNDSSTTATVVEMVKFRNMAWKDIKTALIERSRMDLVRDCSNFDGIIAVDSHRNYIEITLSGDRLTPRREYLDSKEMIGRLVDRTHKGS